MAACVSLFESRGDDFAWSLLDAAPDATVIVDATGEIVALNDHAGTLFGFAFGDLQGRTVDDLLPESNRELHRAHRAAYQADPAVRPMGAGLGLRARRCDGSTFPVEISLSPLRVGDDTFTVAAVRDISHRLAAEAELRNSQDQLRASEQVVAMAADRERIALDLHDTVIQRLFAAGLDLQSTLAGTHDDRTRIRIDATIDALDEAIKELRSAIFDLHTPSTTPGGLRGQLLDVLTDSAGSLGFEPRLQFDGPIDSLDDTLTMHLEPVLREALSNIIQHAHATHVRVVVTVTDNLTLTVADDGDGMPDEVLGGNGLSNMAQRARALGGGFTITPQPNRGSVLIWHVPTSDSPTPQPVACTTLHPAGQRRP